MLLFLFRHEGRLIVVHKGARAHILLLRAVADTVARGTYVLQEGVQLGRTFLSDFEAQNGAELLNDGLHSINSITDGHFSALLVLTHTDTPEVLRLVGSKAGRLKFGRRRQEIHHVRQLSLGKIGITVLLVLTCKYRHCATYNKEGGNDKLVEFVHNNKD